MHSDKALEHERNGADAGLNPMFGNWQHRFEFAPISYAAGGLKRAAFQEAIQTELKNRFFYTNEVRLDIVLHLDVQTVLETDETADVDNYAKAILDGLKGPNGILFDDTQVQALTIYWLDSYGRDRTYFEVSISRSPDDFMLKPVEFYEMPDGLWYPHGRRMWSDGDQEDQSDRNHYSGLLILEAMSSAKRGARQRFRKSGMDRLRAYQKGMYLSSSARGFHRSRIVGFPMHPRRDWRAAFETWRADHAEEIAEIERIVADVRDNYGNIAALLARPSSRRTQAAGRLSDPSSQRQATDRRAAYHPNLFARSPSKRQLSGSCVEPWNGRLRAHRGPSANDPIATSGFYSSTLGPQANEGLARNALSAVVALTTPSGREPQLVRDAPGD